MPQNNYVERHIKKYGRQLDYEIKKAKKESRQEHIIQAKARKLHGWKAIMFAKQRYKDKVQLKRDLKIKESVNKTVVTEEVNPLPHFLLDRGIQNRARDMNDKIKQQRQEKAAKYSVPLPKIQGLSEAEVFGMVSSGKRKNKHWKRMVTKPCFVGDDFTRKPPKYERFIRPMAMRFKQAHVTHPELQTTFCLPILGIKQNPHSDVFTSLGVLTKGTIIEVNVSELGMVAPNGKVIWGKYAQITNKPENDGIVNALLLA